MIKKKKNQCNQTILVRRKIYIVHLIYASSFVIIGKAYTMSRRKEKIWHSIYRSTWSSFRKKNPYITILGISASLFFPFFFFLLAFPKRSGVHRPTGRTTVKDRIKRILTCWSLNNGFNLANGFPCVLAQFYLTITSFNHHTNLEKNSIIKSLSSSLYSHHHPRVARGKKKKLKAWRESY